MDIIDLIQNGDYCHSDLFHEFVCEQPEVWTHGAPGIGILITDPITDDAGVVYSDVQGWTNIWTRWVKQKLNDGWVFLPDGRIAAPEDHREYDPGYWPQNRN